MTIFLGLLWLLTGFVSGNEERGDVPASPDSTVVMLFAGDLVLSNHVERYVGERYSYVFEKWQSMGDHDLFMVNLEHPITTAEVKVEKQFNFKLHPRYVETLRLAGIDIVNAANNHIADYGLRGLLETIQHLDSVGIRCVGIGRNLQEARKPVVLKIKGVRVGFLGYHGGGRFAATRSAPGIAPRSLPIVQSDVEQLRPTVDYLVVNFHWGTELAESPSSDQVSFARAVVEAGADLVVGHHPHVLQGIERYRGSYIAYSLGNFVFGGKKVSTYATAILRATVSRTNAKVELVPVTVEQWQPRRATGPARDAVLSLVHRRSLQFPEFPELTEGTHHE
jgi:poly-gamma-glutamate synthesis protein (capsule biosynthesis protein)